MTFDLPLTTYILVGPLAWLALWAGLLLARKRMGRLRGKPKPLPEPPPMLSIVVPAKDEASHIEACVRGLLAQDYPAFELIVVDDRSADGTRETLDHLAAAHGAAASTPSGAAALRVMHVDRLPEGWLGKCHALHVGTRDLRGDWILFVDSDVALEPHAARAVVALAAGRAYDALSTLNRINPRSRWESLMIPLLGATWGTMFTISLTNDDNRPHVAAANGQLFLVRREAYEAVGGHAAVRNEIVEDVELMRTLKSAGRKCRFMIGSHLAATHMHATLPELRRGWGRIFAGTARYRPGRIWAAIAFAVVGGLSVYPALAYALWRWVSHGDLRWAAAAGAHLLLLTGFLAYVYRASHCRGANAFLVPVSFPVMIGLLWEGLRRCRDRRFEWRGTAVTIPAARAEPGGRA